jgi:hypothetical protein
LTTAPLKTFRLTIAGLGIVFYSPFAVAGIAEDEDFLESALWDPEDVATLVNSCRFGVVATGTSGDFIIHVLAGQPDEPAVMGAEFKARLCLEVRDGEVQFRDLYDFMQWRPDVPGEQCVPMENGFHRVTVYSSSPTSGILGDDQAIYVHFERAMERPLIKHAGVPQLCPDDE